MRRLLFRTGLTALTAGCAVGPDYHPAPPATEAGWSGSQAPGVSDRPADTATWWKSFHDAELDSLVSRAVAANLDLRAAEARLRFDNLHIHRGRQLHADGFAFVKLD